MSDESTYRWATVTQLDPLRIRLDGDSTELPLTPEALIEPSRLMVGTRVWVQFFGRRVIVVSATGNHIDAGRMTQVRQRALTGGGKRTVTDTGVSWGARFIAMAGGKNSMCPSGYWEISMPADGTVIPVLNHSGVTSVTVAGGLIPMTYWQTLWYELPIGETAASQPSRFHIVGYTGVGGFEPPASWVMVVTTNNDSTQPVPKHLWGDGYRQDVWRTPTLTNSWVAYGSGWPSAAYRVGNDGRVHLRGLVKNGSMGIATPIFTLPSGWGPEGGSGGVGLIFNQVANVSGSTGFCRVDVVNDGRVGVIQYGGGAGNGYVSLAGISFFPAGT